MPDVYSERVALEFHLPGALTAGATTLRRVIPFDYAIIGAVASVNTAPAGANLIFDVLAGPNNTAQASLVSIWSVNNGTDSNPDHRPTIVAGSHDQAAIAAGTYTVAPEGTDPALQGQTSGVSTTYATNDPYPYLAKPDTNPSAPTVTFGGNQPFNESPESPIDISTQSGADEESAGVNQLPAGGTVGYVGKAGDAINVTVAQVGSTTAGSDATVTVYVVPQ